MFDDKQTLHVKL